MTNQRFSGSDFVFFVIDFVCFVVKKVTQTTTELYLLNPLFPVIKYPISSQCGAVPIVDINHHDTVGTARQHGI